MKRDRFVENLKLDIYGKLLTNVQQKVFAYYYCDDYSMPEIAEKMRTSRQGVFKNLKQARSILDRYEKTLRIAQKSIKIKELIQKLKETSNREKRKKIIKKLEGVL